MRYDGERLRINQRGIKMTDSIQNAIDYLAETQDKMMEDYKALLRFPSISADPAHAGDVRACADWILGQLEAMGFDNCEAIATAGHPVVYGEWLKAGADKPTILVYAHYDVQPVDPLPLWDTEPFEGVIKERKIFPVAPATIKPAFGATSRHSKRCCGPMASCPST